MIMENNEDAGVLSIVAIDQGNSHTALARWVEGNVEDVERVPTADSDALHAALASVRGKCENTARQAIVIASVVPEHTAALVAFIEDSLDLRAFVVGDNTPLPAETALPEPGRVGADRVCAAAAAFERTQQACVIIDVGSAVTVDLIDDEGVFQGGAILPGLDLQSKALAEWTAKLPRVQARALPSVLGKTTEEAIASGLCYGLAGAVRGIVERIAMERNGWPQTVLTGGAGELLHAHMDFVDSWVPDLCLMGVGLAYMKRVMDAGTGHA